MTRTLLSNGTVFDGSGSEPAVGDVVMEDGVIVDVGVGLDGDEAIDCHGRLVTPGLFDCHVHFMADGDFSPNTHASTPFAMNWFLAAERMRRTLDCGITTVREAGGTDLGVKEAQEQGLVAGPRMQLSITILSQTGGHGDNWEVCGAHMPGMMDEHPGRPHNIVDGPDEMRRKVRELIRAGADVIKVCTSGGVISPRDDPQHAHFMADELDMLVAEATAGHRFVMAHAQATEGIKNAVRAGIRSIEHGIYLDDEAIQMMLDAGTYLVPTLIAPLGVLEASDRGVDLPEVVLDKARAVVDIHRASISAAIDAGVRIATGTDSGVTPHGQNLRELAEMQRLGMSPIAVLESSTRIAAELMGVEAQLGTLEVGKIADLVVFDGTDLDLSDLRSRVSQVYQSGVVVA
ncbi:MAG: amidohydrolase family protein [Ilumatobacter sp.]